MWVLLELAVTDNQGAHNIRANANELFDSASNGSVVPLACMGDVGKSHNQR